MLDSSIPESPTMNESAPRAGGPVGTAAPASSAEIPATSEPVSRLEEAVVALRREVAAHERDSAALREARESLSRLTIELTRSEARERRAIAEELHDHVGQALAMVQMRLTAMAGKAAFTGLEGDIGELRELVTLIIRRTRSLTCEISPPMLYELGLGPALHWLAEETTRQHALPVRVKGDAPPPVGEEVAEALFRVARELLANVIKHSAAKSATVELAGDAVSLRLVVSDDGRGFDPEAALARSGGEDCGFGIFSIRERVRSLGGSVVFHSAPGAGARVEVSVPRGGGR
jgi:signal transduction histidine kinase